MQKHFGILLDMGQDDVFKKIDKKAGTVAGEVRTVKAIKATTKIVLSRLLGLYIQLVACPGLTPGAWLWFQCSNTSADFFKALRRAVTLQLQTSDEDDFTDQLLLALRDKCANVTIIGAVDEAQKLVAEQGYSKSWVRVFIVASCCGLCCIHALVCVTTQGTAPVGGAGEAVLDLGERSLLSPVIQALSMVLSKVVISGTALSLYDVSTVTSSLYKGPEQGDWIVEKIVNQFQPWRESDFQTALGNCLADFSTLSSHMLPPDCFPGDVDWGLCLVVLCLLRLSLASDLLCSPCPRVHSVHRKASKCRFCQQACVRPLA